MKINYTPLSIRLTILLSIFTVAASAQQIEYLNSNNANAGFGIGGSLFTMFPDSAAHGTSNTAIKYGLIQVPKNSGASPIFTAGLWMSGSDAGGNISCAAQRYHQNGTDFYDGPIVSTYYAAYDN